jgi:uncharacterized membrane protein YdjX (TVP38/TMEM64 family)
MLRLLGVFVVLAVAVIVPFLIWGGRLEEALSPEAAAAWLREVGPWAWLAGIGLLMGDLLLPIPATAVMSALGLVYGVFLGGMIGAAGSILAGAAGYLLCRALGRSMAVRILGPKGLAEGERLAHGSGVWLVVLSRWLPVFPEVVACMAGLTRMPPRRFLMALACGSIPLSFAFAALGAAGLEHPMLALVVSAAAPPVLWLFARKAFESTLRRGRPATSHQDA